MTAIASLAATGRLLRRFSRFSPRSLRVYCCFKSATGLSCGYSASSASTRPVFSKKPVLLDSGFLFSRWRAPLARAGAAGHPESAFRPEMNKIPRRCARPDARAIVEARSLFRRFSPNRLRIELRNTCPHTSVASIRSSTSSDGRRIGSFARSARVSSLSYRA